MPQIFTTVLSAGTSIFKTISGNARANDQQQFQQDQAAMQAAYERDLSTTKSFEEWAKDQQSNIQQFNLANSSANTTKYAIAAGIVIMGGVMLMYFLKKT